LFHVYIKYKDFALDKRALIREKTQKQNYFVENNANYNKCNENVNILNAEDLYTPLPN